MKSKQEHKESPNCNHGKRIVLSSSNKGGVGKSFFNIQYVEWLREHPEKPTFRAFDPDDANKTLLSYHSEVTQFIDVDRSQSLDACLTVLSDEVAVSVVDGLGSQQKKTMLAWAKEISLFEVCRDNGIQITFVQIIEDDRDVILQCRSLLEEIGDAVDWLFVLNQKQGKDFMMWKDSETRKLAYALGGIEMVLPKVPDHIAVWCSSNRQSLVQAQSDKRPHLLDQQRFRTYWRLIKEEMDQVSKVLLP